MPTVIALNGAYVAPEIVGEEPPATVIGDVVDGVVGDTVSGP